MKGEQTLLNRLFGKRKKGEAIEITTDKSVYNSSEKITIHIKNSGKKDIEDLFSCTIYDDKDVGLYSFKIAQVARKLRAGEIIGLSWKQLDNERKQVVDGIYKVECSFAELSGDATFEIKSKFAKIGAIIANPKNYSDKEIMVRGKFIGWSIPEHEIKTFRVTRNDWLIEDPTGTIYITKLNADPLIPWESSDVGKQIILVGRVMSTGRGPCIEGKSLQAIK